MALHVVAAAAGGDAKGTPHRMEGMGLPLFSVMFD